MARAPGSDGEQRGADRNRASCPGSRLSASNISTVITISAMLAIVTLSQTIVLISGGFDLSVGGVVPISSVVFALLSNGGLPFLPALMPP